VHADAERRRLGGRTKYQARSGVCDDPCVALGRVSYLLCCGSRSTQKVLVAAPVAAGALATARTPAPRAAARCEAARDRRTALCARPRRPPAESSAPRGSGAAGPVLSAGADERRGAAGSSGMPAERCDCAARSDGRAAGSGITAARHARAARRTSSAASRMLQARRTLGHLLHVAPRHAREAQIARLDAAPGLIEL
jgi:hypothetical protein